MGLMCAHDMKGVLVFINPAAAHSLGYSPEDGVGRSLRDFLAPPVRPEFDAYLDRIRKNPTDSGVMRLVAKDGSERIWLYRNVRYQEPGIPPLVLGHAQDITERIRAEKALRDSEEKYRGLVENIPEVVYRSEFRDNPRTVYLSRRMEDLTGYPVENFLSDWNFWGQLIHPEDRERVNKEVEEAIRTAFGFQSEYRLRHKGGGERFVMDIAKPFKDGNGAVRWWDGIVIDITDRKRAEQQLIQNAMYDPLTDLANRTLLMDRLATAAKRRKRRGESYLFGVLFVDLDRFKNVNDSLGHDIGDKLLIAVAGRLEKCVRS